MLLVLGIILLQLAISHGTETDYSEPPIFMTDLAAYYGYKFENYTVETSDGFYLTLGRLPSPKDESACLGPRGTTILVHGMMNNGEMYMAYPDSLGYQLVDNCYDVWLLNIRGTRYSMRHKHLQPSNRLFWAYNMEDVAQRDLKESIDLIRKVTGDVKLHFVGFSQGAVPFWMLLVMEPNYLPNIKTAHLIAPVTWTRECHLPNLHNSLFSKIATLPECITRAYPDRWDILYDLSHEACYKRPKPICTYLLEIYNGIPELAAEFALRCPDKLSWRIIGHFLQFSGSELRRYDWGPKENLKLYGSKIPPAYNLSAVKPPVYIYHSSGDHISTPSDVEMLAKKLPNVAENYLIKNDSFSHNHMTLAKGPDGDKMKLRIIENLNDFELKH